MRIIAVQTSGLCRNIRYKACPIWKLTDDTLKCLGEKFPTFDQKSCLLKSVAVNALYSTNVLAIARMADHVCETMGKHQENKDKPELRVEAIARLQIGTDKYRCFPSFASKFCHFFVDVGDDKFPIYDEAARMTVKLHLGKIENPYPAFCAQIHELKASANFTCLLSELDRYLWIRGLYVKYKKSGRKINKEIMDYFNGAKTDEEKKHTLESLLNENNGGPGSTSGHLQS